MTSLNQKEVIEANPKKIRSKRKQRSKAAHYDSLQVDTSQTNFNKVAANKKIKTKKGDRDDSDNSRQMTRAEKKAEKVEARRQIKVLNQIEVSPW